MNDNEVMDFFDEKEKCPRCGAEMASGRYGIYCPAKCGFKIGNKIFGAPISEEQKHVLLKGEEILVEGVISKRTGKPYNVYVKANGVEDYTYTRKDGTEAVAFGFALERRFPGNDE